jgi:hypothetical protein|tara:strand:- start:44 stop:169 length:126 start_codon:yes stop_codon:yes gene_type:complete
MLAVVAAADLLMVKVHQMEVLEDLVEEVLEVLVMEQMALLA